MTPTNNSSVPSSCFFMEKDDDQDNQRLVLASQEANLFSRPMTFNTTQDDQEGFHYRDREKMQLQEQVGEMNSTSVNRQYTGQKITICKKQERIGNQTDRGSVKWTSSKMRMMRKMMSSEHTHANHSVQKFEDQKQPSSSSLETTNSGSNKSPYSNSSSSNNTIVRVCADCNTTKTPLWRSGPKGPKSLCNACGIRQRKARRAMAAAAAAANGAVPEARSPSMKSKVQHKENKRSREGYIMPFKKRFKVKSTPSREKNKICFEDLKLNLSKHSALQGVFPQDEKEGAILLMALSYGLVHG